MRQASQISDTSTNTTAVSSSLSFSLEASLVVSRSNSCMCIVSPVPSPTCTRPSCLPPSLLAGVAVCRCSSSPSPWSAKLCNSQRGRGECVCVSLCLCGFVSASWLSWVCVVSTYHSKLSLSLTRWRKTTHSNAQMLSFHGSLQRLCTHCGMTDFVSPSSSLSTSFPASWEKKSIHVCVCVCMCVCVYV